LNKRNRRKRSADVRAKLQSGRVVKDGLNEAA